MFEDQLNTHTPGFVTGVTDDLPYAVRADVATRDTGKDGDLTDDDLAATTQAFVVDDPVELSLPPDPGKNGFVAAGVKEGHGIGRQGVALVGDLAPPPRHDTVRGGRRPVVALVDSPVREHPWLGHGRGSDEFWSDARSGPDGFDPTVGEGSTAVGLPDEPEDAEATHAGHGTFLAGIVRQIAPDARVLAVPVMRPTGVVDDVLAQHALDWILRRCQRAQQEGNPDLAVDIVNLSFGQYLRGPRKIPGDDHPFLTTIRALGDLGVRVVTSAGNRATVRPAIPAAWAPEEPDVERTDLLSVGALDPDGDPAVYSNSGAWVRLAAPGTALVSTLPEFPPVDPWPRPGMTGRPTLGEDPNLQASRFGRWAGTSFAAGWVSASLARALLDPAVGADLTDLSSGAAQTRARAALAAVLAEGRVRPWTGERAAG